MSKQLYKEIQQDYVSEFSNNVHRRHDKQHFIKGEASFKARGIKVLQQPTVYILAVIFAFCLYQLDRLYDFRQVYSQQSQNLNELSDNLKTLPDKSQEMPTYAILIISMVVLSLILASKRVYQNRKMIEQENRKNAIEQAQYEEKMKQKAILKGQFNEDACEKITEEEFDYQSNVTTRREIAKLVNSQEYKDAMAKKGQNLSAWNWQANDRDQGIIHDAEDREVEGFDLAEELDQVDDQLNIGRSKVSLKYKTQRQNQTYSHQKSEPIDIKSGKQNQELLSPKAIKRIRNLVTPSTQGSEKYISSARKKTIKQ